MESAPIPLKINYVVYCKILKIEWLNRPDGWFVHFEGSWESINFGIERPAWSVGDIVKITFEQQEAPCPPSPTTSPTTSPSSSS